MVYCPQEWSNEAGLQLLLSSVSSKRPANENDGVWGKWGPPTEWLINLRAKQPGLLKGKERFAEWSLKLSSRRGGSYMFRQNGWKCGYSISQQLFMCCQRVIYKSNLYDHTGHNYTFPTLRLGDNSSVYHVYICLSCHNMSFFIPGHWRKSHEMRYFRDGHTHFSFPVSSLDGVIRVTLTNKDMVRLSH